MRPSISLAVVALTSFLLSGCIPGVSWLPDSSGFVYVEKAKIGTSLVRFDLATKKRTVLVEDTKTFTCWPAISPDAKQIAVANWTQEKGKRDTLQVIIYDMKGKVQKRSQVFLWINEKRDRDEAGMTFLTWTTRGHLMVWAKNTAIYDIAKDTIAELPDALAFPGASNNPVRPDGKGFLALFEKEKEALAFVDWTGKVTRLKGNTPEEDNDFPWNYTLTWDKNVAVLSGRGGTLRAETDKQTVKTQPSTFPKLVPGSEGKIECAFAFPGSKNVICVFRREKGDPARPTERDTIELHDTAANTRKVIVPVCNAHTPVFFSSPDRKKVVFRYQEGVVKNERILVIDQTGKVVAQFLAGDIEE